MAGLALYGDLAQVIGSHEPLQLRTRLESVKLLPPSGENPPDLYGALTDEAVARAENKAQALTFVSVVFIWLAETRRHK